MNERKRPEILWRKSFASFATTFWTLGTYLGLLFGAVWMACRLAKGDSCERASAAYMGVLLATGLHWILFCMIERGHQETTSEK